MKDMIISTSRLNSYGSRVLTEGIDTSQFERNPVLLWMHTRWFDAERGVLPIGRVENLRVEGDALIGTPVFDLNDEFARQVADKWENGFLKMCSAGLEIVETSQEDRVVGQTRPTITRSKLVEVSIVDIGANDDALQLLHGGRVLNLAKGIGAEVLPLLEPEVLPGNQTNNNISIQLNNKTMKKETLELLSLGADASEEMVHEAVASLKAMADRARVLELSAISQMVDGAIGEGRVAQDKREHFVELGKMVGVEKLRDTLAALTVAVRPSDVICHAAGGAGAPAEYKRLGDVPEEKVMELKEQNPQEYARLYKAEYGVEM